MASTYDYLDYVLQQLSLLDDISYRPMMGEFIIYYKDKIIGGIYDNRFLVKTTASASAMMPEAERQLPYEGTKEMLLVSDIENKDFLYKLIDRMYDELPSVKKKTRGKGI